MAVPATATPGHKLGSIIPKLAEKGQKEGFADILSFQVSLDDMGCRQPSLTWRTNLSRLEDMEKLENVAVIWLVWEEDT
ncbi:hypothetical protein BTVI_90400 [Pitangus sulphuratus]|nr:hypothetical protein BTVI_90400 [Pitangus sulphuratus]